MRENKSVYSVRQINHYIKRLVEEDFALRNIYVRGEISNCKYHYSGHIYFSMKDESGVIQAVMFASNAANLKIRLEDGMQAIAYGSISVYERDGKYQLYVRDVEHAGQGDLFRRFEELKAQLSQSGMFDPMYKKPVPPYAMKIGVVTAETGAVIRDIYNVASRRNPYCQIWLYPAKVQGDGAAKTICDGIRTLDQMGLDVLIIGRGGGSIEDLWAFNEECVAREIFRAQTPIISAVGHETDFTIADFVADLRAPTPSAAAELAVFDYARFEEDLAGRGFSLRYQMNQSVKRSLNRLQSMKLQLDVASPRNRILKQIQYLQDERNRLDEGMIARMAAARERLIALSERLQGLSPLKRLSEGYAFITGPGGCGIRSVRDVQTDDRIHIYLADGELDARVLDRKEQEIYHG